MLTSFLSSDIVIAAVDATTSQDLAKKYGVTGYPTIKYFPKGESVDKASDYDGGRTADTIVSWVNNKIGTNRKVKTAPSAVAALTDSNFEAEALGKKAALVEFYAPWCGHCKQLAPKYETLANNFAGEKDVLIAKVDATEYGELANQFGVTGYPTLKFFPAGSKDPIDYDSEREVAAMTNFLNEHAGTKRNADGSLQEGAGHVEELNTIIKNAGGKFDEQFLNSLNTAVEGLTGKDATFGKIYSSSAAKVVSKGAEFPAKEIARLDGLLKSPSVTAEQKGNFQLRQSILKAFL